MCIMTSHTKQQVPETSWISPSLSPHANEQDAHTRAHVHAPAAEGVFLDM